MSLLRFYPRVIEAYDSLPAIHEQVRGVDMSGELHEQQLIFDFLDRDSTGVLEFGGNIGRTSIVINKLLRAPRNHVVFESDPESVRVLEENRKANGCSFMIVPAALSDRPVMIQQGWHAHAHDTANGMHASFAPPEGWKRVNTISFQEFKRTFPIEFDTLVVDCEGCITQILLDHGTELLQSVKTVIIENDDFVNANVPQNVTTQFLLNHGFQSVECRDLDPQHPKCFFQVWKRS